MQKVIVEESAHIPINIAIVWTNMLPTDNETAAISSARLITDSRARHFYDSNALVGKAIASRLGSPGAIAWDFYLFFSSGLKWHQKPPIPVEWAHQLSDAWADSKHFFWDENLVQELRRVMENRTKSN